MGVVSLIFIHSTLSYMVLVQSLSLGGVFGVLRLQGEFFVWTTSWGKILRCENLMKRGFTLAGWCCR